MLSLSPIYLSGSLICFAHAVRLGASIKVFSLVDMVDFVLWLAAGIVLFLAWFLGYNFVVRA